MNYYTLITNNKGKTFKVYLNDATGFEAYCDSGLLIDAMPKEKLIEFIGIQKECIAKGEIKFIQPIIIDLTNDEFNKVKHQFTSQVQGRFKYNIDYVEIFVEAELELIEPNRIYLQLVKI